MRIIGMGLGAIVLSYRPDNLPPSLCRLLSDSRLTAPLLVTVLVGVLDMTTAKGRGVGDVQQAQHAAGAADHACRV